MRNASKIFEIASRELEAARNGPDSVRHALEEIVGLCSLLKSLEKHNTERAKASETAGNGIACPNCGNELRDTGISFLTHPPTIEVECPACSWKGYRAE